MNLLTIDQTRKHFNAGNVNFIIEYDSPGHIREYTVNIRGYNHDNHIPRWIDRTLQSVLGPNWDVCNRGSRIEITSNDRDNPRDDAVVMAAVTQVCNNN